MQQFVARIIVVLALCPCVAIGGSVCIQNDTNGDVLVIKGVGKGAKAVTAYLADFQGGSSYDFVPLSGAAILESDGHFAAGFTEYGVSGGGGFSERTRFHRVRCNVGSDGKLSELDTCTDITWDIPQDDQSIFPGHVVPCLSQLKVP